MASILHVNREWIENYSRIWEKTTEQLFDSYDERGPVPRLVTSQKRLFALQDQLQKEGERGLLGYSKLMEGVDDVKFLADASSRLLQVDLDYHRQLVS